MSAEPEWGGIVRHRLPLDDGTDDATDLDRDPIELHADQEELEYEAYADSAMTIPAKGEEGPNCQTWGMYQFCDECAEPQPAMSRCERRECPHCGHTMWEPERTTGIVQRVAKGRYAEDDGLDRRVVHGVVSAPTNEEWESEQIVTIQQWYDGYGKAYDLAKEQGIRGGVVIGHGYRVADSVKAKYRSMDLDYGVWKWIEQDLPKSWRCYTYWSPHYHVIGLCRDLAENKPEQQDGWNCVRIRSLSSFTGPSDREGIEDMVRAVRYPLSHATFQSGTQKDCVRYFGSLSPGNFTAEEEMSSGVIDTIDRVVEEVVGDPIEDDDEEGGFGADQGDKECVNDECDSTSFSSIFDAGAALMDKSWCEEIGGEQQRRLEAAFEWAIGERKPPPGLKNPRTEAEAREALEAML
jgi:hypothetical protein